ncbi:MAG: hypothetical protein JWQ04_2708 [Pedosphaera sp.]|nr:hypothetical protein [Pedosphaera sp.]
MRVIHLLRKYNPSEWGGTETAIQRLFDGLRRQEVASVVYAPRIEKNLRIADPLAEAGCEVRRFNAFVPILGMPAREKRQLISVGGNLMSFDLLASLWREREISIVHAHTLGRIGAMGRTVARRRKVPLVLTIHGGLLDLPETIRHSIQQPRLGGWDWGKIFGLLLGSRGLLEEADAIVTCNPTEAGLLQEKFPGKRIQVQPHGVVLGNYQTDHRAAALAAFPQLLSAFVPKRSQYNERPPSPRPSPPGEGEGGGRSGHICGSRLQSQSTVHPAEDKYGECEVLLSVGRIDPVKNQAWLVEQLPAVFQRHPRALMVFAGACTDEKYGKRIERQIAELGLGNRVLLTGGLPPGDARLIGLMQLAAAVILPSLSETFGLVLLEAWAAGTAVISSRTSGATALIKQDENGWLFDLEQPGTFQRVVDTALANPDLRKQLAARGGELVAAQYDTFVLAGRMKNLYETLIEEKNALRHSTR